MLLHALPSQGDPTSRTQQAWDVHAIQFDSEGEGFGLTANVDHAASQPGSVGMKGGLVWLAWICLVVWYSWGSYWCQCEPSQQGLGKIPLHSPLPIARVAREHSCHLLKGVGRLHADSLVLFWWQGPQELVYGHLLSDLGCCPLLQPQQGVHRIYWGGPRLVGPFVEHLCCPFSFLLFFYLCTMLKWLSIKSITEPKLSFRTFTNWEETSPP